MTDRFSGSFFSLIFGLVLVAVLASSASVRGDIRNPALNPVRITAVQPAHDPVMLVKDGVAQAIVIIPDGSGSAAEIHQHAAGEFIRHIQQATGVTLACQTDAAEPPEGLNLVLIGFSRLSRERGLNDAKNLPLEGFHLQTFPGGLSIIGRLPDERERNDYGNSGLYNPRHSAAWGELFGVYDFLERFLGLRCFYPDELGMVMPKTSKVAVPPCDYSDWPQFSLRIGEHWAFWKPDERLTNAAAAAKYGAYFRRGNSSYFSAATHTPIHWGVHAEDAPETLELRSDGTREPNYPCFGNPRTLEVLMADLERFYANRDDRIFRNPENQQLWCPPTPWQILVCPPDKPPSCQCEHCRPLWRKDLGGHGVASDLICHFTAELARKVKERWPEKAVIHTAYSSYFKYPGNLVFPDNVSVKMTKMYGTASGKDPRVAAAYNEMIDQWRKAAPGGRLFLTEYSCWPAESTFLPFQYPHVLQKFYRDNRDKLTGVFICGHGEWQGRRSVNDQTWGGEWAYSHLTLYLWYRLLWNPDYDVDTGIDDYCRSMYGTASPPMRELFRILTDRWEQVPWSQPIVDHTISHALVYGETMPKPQLEKLALLYQEALNLAGNDQLLKKRVEFVGAALQSCFREADSFFAAEKPLMQIKRVDKAPLIDGILDDPQYKQAEVCFSQPGMNVLKPDEKIPRNLNIYPLWCPEGLIIAVRCFENFTPIASLTGRDDRIYEGDCLEVFLQTSPEFYFHLIINQLGGFYDAKNRDRSFDFKRCQVACQSKEQTGKNYWTAEILLPFDELGITPETGREFSGNIMRTRRFELHQRAYKENHRWSTTYRQDNHDRNAFSTMKLVE